MLLTIEFHQAVLVSIPFTLADAGALVVLFFMFGVLLVFIGILGEYVASIHSYVRRRPLVFERERINF